MSDDGVAAPAARLERLSPAQRALLAKRLRERKSGADAAGEQPADDSSDDVVLSFAQERMWLLAELTPGLYAYNTARVVRLRGNVDADRLRAALTAVIRDHHVLRTRVRRAPDGNPVAFLAEPSEALLEVVSVGDESGARSAVEALLSRPFDLAEDDLLRAMLVRVDDDLSWLALSVHHIASDEGSRAVLWASLDAAYSGRPISQPARQYAEFARAQRQELAGPRLAADIEWWRQHLAGAPTVAELPVDHSRPALQTYRGRRLEVSLEADLLAALRAFAAAQSTTPFVAVVAAFSWLMSLWTREEDVVLGMPVSGRDHPGAEGLIGLFVNTVVVRADCSGAPDFATLVARTREQVVASLSHQEVPLERIVEALAPARDLSRNPLFQVGVNSVTTEQAREFPLGDLGVETVRLDPRTTKYDIGLLVRESSEGAFTLVFEFSSDLFEDATIEALADELLTLLRGALAAPGCPLAELTVSSEAQRRRLVEEVNATEAPIPEGCLHEAIAAQAARTPDAVAVADEERSLTYAELDRQANALAHHLRDLGVGAGVLVAVGVPRSVAMELAVLGILKAGGAYVPLDTTYPSARLAFMLQDSGAAVLITDAATRSELPDHPVTVLVDELDQVLAGRPTTAPETGVTPDDLCYVIYTSGSTGRPKGAELRHRGVMNRLDWMQRTYHLTGTDTVLQKTPLSFDVSAWEVLWPLLTGARLFLARPDGQRDPAYLARVVRRERVTVMHFVPSMLSAFLGSPATAEVVGSGLRVVVCSGEALGQELKEQFFALLPEVGLHNLYGPTEASIDVTWHECRPGPAHRVRIGAPISNVQTYVLDTRQRPVPIGVPGELYLGGVQLARGYLNRPDLTAERFVPLDLAPDGRAYRTGDLVRWTSDGEIDYLGRLDDQVKLRGFRIELGEIEAVLASHPDVAASCAAIVTLPSGEPTLAAYIVVREEAVAALAAEADDGAWEGVWEDIYQQDGVADPYFDTRGWVSSVTHEEFTEREMRDWVQSTVDRLLPLVRDRDVLEVGCGSGMLLWPLAPASARYVATDLSTTILAGLPDLVVGAGLADRVSVLPLAADRVSPESLGAELPAAGFGVVVLNSVLQYLADRAHAATVIGRLQRLVATDGALFLGDVPDVRLHELFAFRVEYGLHQRSRHRSGAVDPSPAELRLRIQDRQQLDTELLLAPDFFTAVVGVDHVQVMPRRGRPATEMNDFRYDVLISRRPPRSLEEWVDWSTIGSLAALEDRLTDLAAAAHGGLGVRRIPNARLVGDQAGLADLAQGRLPDVSAPLAGVHPDELWELGERYGLHVELSVLEDAITVAAAFTFDPAPVLFASGASGVDASDPVAARARSRVRAATARTVTQMASERLPEYMVPAAVRALPSLPLGLSGKLDRSALPAPLGPGGPSSVTPPRTLLERQLFDIWAQLLGIDDFGVEDDFFRLGGHSLLAVRMLSAVSRTLGVLLPLAAVFRSPTVAGLAAELAATDSSASRDADEPLEPVDRAPRRRALRRLDDPEVLAEALAGTGTPDPDADVTVFPLSAAQQRMWFLDALEEGRPVYTVRRSYRVSGGVDIDRLAAALDALAAQHDSLRTTVRYRGEVLAAVVADRSGWPLQVVDVSGEADPEGTARAHSREVAAQPFDLEHGPLATAYWYRLGPDEAVFVLRLHHVLVDGWGLDVLMDDLRLAYDASGSGATADLPATLQYPDCVVWQDRHHDDTRTQRDLAYWRHRLAGAPSALELPTDRPRPPTPTSAGHRVSSMLGAALTEQVRALAREHGTTPFSVLLAGTAALLSRLSGQDDVVVGTAVAGRNRPEVEHTVGLFANTLLLRTDMSGDPCFGDLLARCHTTLAEAQDHQDLPFERLVEELSPERDLGRNPLFQVLVNLVPSRSGELALGAAVLAPFELESPFTRFDLGITFSERADGLSATIEYRSDLYDAATVERMLTRLEAMLRVGSSVPETRLHELPLMTSAEERTVLGWGTNLGRETPTTALELVARQAARHPARVAVRAPGETDVTYAELWRRSGELAGRISAQVPAGASVGILVGRGSALVVSTLAVWRAGCCYLPLDEAYPEDRRSYMLEDAGAALLVDDAFVAAGGGEEHQPPTDRDPGPDDLAYVIYTSGSTGRPKGVEVEHRSLANLLLAMAEQTGFGDDETLAAVTTFSFDIAALELFLPLVTGACVVVLDRETAADPDRLAAELERSNVTTLQATPATWRMLLADNWPGRPGLRALCGGEALTSELARALRPRVGELWNCYGPTETTIWSTLSRVEDPDRVDIGGPLLDTATYVLDAGGRLVPPGSTGELWIGGGGVARGYHDRADLTAERFRPDPWQPGRRMYRTGDLAVWTADGHLTCLGRTDSQVKLRGHRIELGEIESVIEARPEVSEAAVVLREDHAGDHRIVGYVVAGTDDLGPVTDALRAALPAYMVPSALVRLDAMPRTANNKIDRKALPAPVYTRLEGTPPGTAAEVTVARVWSDLLHVDTPHLEDDFFDLGGHSLLATRLTSRLADAIGGTVALRTVFEHTTLGELAAALEAPRPAVPPSGGAGPAPLPRTGRWLDREELPEHDRLQAALSGRSGRDTGELLVWPMSVAQQRMWLLHELAPHDPSYNVPVLRRITGPLDVDALEAAVSALVARHELLRTTYRQVEELLVQIVHHPTDAPSRLVRIEGRGLAWEDVLETVRSHAGAPFDLVAGPALRPVVIQVGEDDWLLLLAMHHIALDGWSIGILLGELAALYAGASLDPPRLQFGEVAVWEHERAPDAGNSVYWTTALAAAPEESTFPLPHGRGDRPATWGRRVRHPLGVDLAGQVEEVARGRRATPFMVLAAAVSALLSRHGAGADLVVGSPVATRSFAGGEDVVGTLINTLALRVPVDADAGFGAHIDAVARVCREGYAHGDHPFERLVSELAVPRSTARHPVFQVAVSWQEAPPTSSPFGAAWLSPVEIDWGLLHFDASFLWSRSSAGIELVLEYAADLFGEEFGARVADRLELFLEAALDNLSRPLGDLPLLSDADQAVLAEWNDTTVQTPAGLVHELVGGQAARTLDAPAVGDATGWLTHRELDERANRLAHHLLSLGAGTDTVVAIGLDRTMDLPVAVLATLRAGAAFLLLDPGHPRERLQFLLEDSSPVALVSHSEFAARLPAHDRLLLLDRFDSSAHPPTAPSAEVSADDLAYVLYTSGTTGRPKGVMVEHRHLASQVWAQQSLVGLDDRDTVLHRVPVSFDPAVLELLMPLMTGARLYLAEPGRHGDPWYLADVIESLGITVSLSMVPSMIRSFLDAGVSHRCRSLRLLIAGGETLPDELKDRFLAALPGASLLNNYGPTETTVTVTAEACAADRDVTIGRPMDNCRVYVLDPRGRLLPPGVQGELYVGGAQVARGYLDRPALTDERFVSSEWGRLYRTGDRAMWRPDGRLAFGGRLDDQVKIHGHRIEPEEVAHVLRGHPAVDDVAVVAEDGELVAYVVLAADADWDPVGLRSDLRLVVPAHLVPSVLVAVPAIPRTPSGKLDRTGLAAAPRTPQTAGDGRAPAGPAEELVAEMWTEILGLEQISAEEDFFDLGGDSLTASRFVARLRGLGIDLPLIEVFSHPTVAGVAVPVTNLLLAGLQDDPTP